MIFRLVFKTFRSSAVQRRSEEIMSFSMKILFGLLAVFYVTVGSNATCCNDYEDMKQVITDCEEETKKMNDKNVQNEICHSLTCVAKKWGVMENGKLNAKKEDDLFKKIFPEASNNLKSKLQECSVKANEQSDDCQVVVKTYNCLFDSPEHRREIDSLIQKREDEH